MRIVKMNGYGVRLSDMRFVKLRERWWQKAWKRVYLFGKMFAGVARKRRSEHSKEVPGLKSWIPIKIGMNLLQLSTFMVKK